PACQRHHLLKHFKDDKTRHGHYRREHDPERTKIRLRGWKPLPTTNGTTAWLSPSGNYHRPQHHEPRPPAYPKWLKKRLNNPLNTALNTPQSTRQSTSQGPKPTLTSPLEQILINYTNTHKK
ncbi:MAG: hypothetical protein Q4P21_14395, partial [Arthrobacter sp.]|nr:hypothetical protein [Arthrobacter sp.]